MSDTIDWLNVANQNTANWIAMQDSKKRYDIDEKTLAQNEKLALAQLDLAEREYYSNIDVMNRNFGMQQAAFDYNKRQAELTRIREDNAFQRRVADTVKAGFSPLAAQGAANASQSPTLTAPQLDPQGVNQATSNRLNAYNSAMQNNNTKRQLQLQDQQLKLAQIETITETLAAVQNLRSQNIINQRNKHELDWYKAHGYRDTKIGTIISDIIRGVNIKGKSISDVASDSINSALEKVVSDNGKTSRDNLEKLIKKQKVKKNVSKNNAINNPKESDFAILTNNKYFADLLSDISKMSSWSKNTFFRKQKVQNILDGLNISYNKDLFKKSRISNDDIKYLQDLLINYRRQIVGN